MKFMRLFLLFVGIASLGLMPACAQKKKEKAKVDAKAGNPLVKANTMDSLSYYLGLYAANHFKGRGLDSLNPEMVGRGFADRFYRGDEVDAEEASAFVEAYLTRAQQEKERRNAERSAEFLEQNGTRGSVNTLPSGLQYEVTTMGSGDSPNLQSTVVIRYKGMLVDGTVFETTMEDENPAELPLRGLIKGWQEALQLMQRGSKWKLYIPSELAYGVRGNRNLVGPNEALIFEVELIDFKPTPPPTRPTR